MPEDFRTLYVDPGDETGWCVGRDCKLLAGGQEKLWYFADEVWEALTGGGYGDGSILNGDAYARQGVEDNEGRIGRIVCEDFRIYPWKLKALKYDPVRTARLIGALTFMARVSNIPLVLQPAAIKDAAKAAGAEEFYVRPQHENRHQNDAVQHFVYFINTELRGISIPVLNEGVEQPDD